MTLFPFRLLIVCPVPPLKLLACAQSLSPVQVCRGRALRLIRDLLVEFRCDKGGHSCWQDGEKAALAAAIALLGGVSKMKRSDFETPFFQRHPKLLTQCFAVSLRCTPPGCSLRLCFAIYHPLLHCVVGG